MTTITNVKVYDLKESIIACRNAMRTEMPEYTQDEFEKSLPRAIQLAKCGGGSGHSNFRKGIRVSFDIKYPNYFSPELQRYHFIDIVSSSSKMHKLAKMNMDACFNKYVTEWSKEQMKKLVESYNYAPTYENFMLLLSNCPLGIELFMRVSTNYESLSTIYRQRINHRLKEDWGAIILMIESLPYAKDLIICEKDK
ncbi:MAG: hypothetical protein ACI4TK_06795 [Agathobacter sp.]